MNIEDNLKLIKTATIQYDYFKIAWDFGGNSSVISLRGNGLTTTSSEHWITDQSDILSFDKHGELVGMGLSIPNMNGILDPLPKTEVLGRIKLSGPLAPCISPKKMRNFDAKDRLLICYDDDAMGGSDGVLLRMRKDFSLVLLRGKYVGYILRNPIDYLHGATGRDRPSTDDYKNFKIFFEIMSDNRLAELGGDMDRLVKELRKIMRPRLAKTHGGVSRVLLSGAIEDLADFYL